MDINIQWVSPTGTAVVDYFNVLYKEFDLYPPLNGLNNWILATDPPLPNTQLNYTITGLKENTIYRIMVTKSCTGLTEIVDEITFIRTGYPVIGTWQGPVVNSYPTLFYSVYYPEGPHIASAGVKLYDTQTYDVMLQKCGAPDPAYVVVGRNGYLTGAICPPVGNSTNYLCDLQALDYLLPSNTSSAVSYFGRDNSASFLPTCDGTGAQPLLLKYNNDYKLYSQAYPRFASNYSSIDPTSAESAVNWPAFTFVSDPTQPYPNLNTANINNISDALCFNPLTAILDYTYADGTGRTNIADYLFSFTTSDGTNTLPLLDNAGNPITSHNGSYTIYAPIKIQSNSVPTPGGGNPLGYTITGALVAGGSTTYTYTGGTNAFTVGQDVFVDNVNPSTFNFASVSKKITAATSNSFTVGSFTPAGTYQTGGVASGYTEITNSMTITVDLQPTQNVITLTNQNYAGLTLIQALNQIAGAINAAGTYTASAVVIGGYPYLKINMPNISYGSASIIFEGPNILTKGGPDIYQVSSYGGNGYSSLSSFSYNGFLYSSFYEASAASIVASDINNPTSATNYSHLIDIPVWEMTLVPEVPPSTVYSLDHITSGGDYSLNIAIDTTTGYTYIADNTTVSVYSGTTLADSQDLSLLPGGPTTPIRLMEFNTTDSTLYVFVDGASNNFYIMVGYGAWVINSVGTYSQTNYVRTSLVTAWNNLTSGPTAAMGTVTSAPTVPIPCTGTNSIPCLPVPNISWNWGANDGINSALFQDSTKSWTVSPQLYPSADFNIYNYANQNLGYMMGYNGTTYYPSHALELDTVRVSAGLSPTYVLPTSAKVTFSISNGDAYGIFHKSKIVDYTANFNSRTWSNLSRYLIKSTSGRNDGTNGFLNTSSPLYHTTTTFDVDYYGRGLKPKDKQLNNYYGLDGTSTYMLFDITDGGTCYNSTSNFVYVSLNSGLYETIDNLGNVLSYQLYKDFPSTSNPVQVPLQMVADPNSDLVYGIARDARSDVDDMNIYVFTEHGQVGVIDGSALWNANICGQISIDSATGILYFTGKHTRNFYEYDPATGLWDNKIVPSLYEKVDGYEYGTASSLSRLKGIVERVQGASYIGNGKFVVMNYMQQTFSTELKYTYEVTNLFVYDYTNNTVEQALIGTGINTYSGSPNSYNPNYYGESFGVNDYNNDYCYGGLSIKVNPSTSQIYWKKSISDQIYFSEKHTESGVAQIWAGSNVQNACSKTIRIWNIQSNGSLVPSKRTILDPYSNFFDLFYDSWYQKVMSCPAASGSAAAQVYAINPKTLGGCHGVDDNGVQSKTGNVRKNLAGLSISTYLSGKATYVYAVTVTPGTITYSVRPTSALAADNGIFPHQYAVGEVVKISGIVSSPVDQLNFPNPNTSSTTYATIISVTATTFTIANTFGATATYTSGGTVIDAIWASIYSAGNFAGIATDKKGSVIVIGNGVGGGLPGYISPYTTFILKYKPSDILTQRENPSVTAIGVIDAICSATPDGLFRGLSSNMGRMYGQLNNAFLIHVPSQNNYWIMGTKNPTCTVNNVTNAVYDSVTQTIRYYINNSFLVGKIVNIGGITPVTYNLTNVAITAVDTVNSPQQWFEISYTGVNPGAFIPPTPPTITGIVSLSPSYVIKVVDDTTLTTIATIDLSSINTLLVGWTNPDAWSGRFQYSPSKEEIYLYGSDPALPIYTFSTITNTLVKSSSFNRMTIPYSKLTTIFGTEDVNGIPYYSAYTATDTPTRRWFRVDLGSRTYINDTHDNLSTLVTDAVTSYTYNYNIAGLPSVNANTFGQWKDILDTTWDTIPNTITTTLNSTIEFVSFKMDSPILSIQNNTTGYLYTTSNSFNYVPVYSILIDNINIQNGQALNFTFANPENPSCPFTRQVTISF